MLHEAEAAVCSQINTKQLNTDSVGRAYSCWMLNCWWQRSRYSDWLRAGRSGDGIPVWARFSAPVQTGPGVHPASCTMGTGSSPGVKSGRGVTLNPHPLQCRSHVRIKLYLYSPYGPYGLYRASLSVKWCTLLSLKRVDASRNQWALKC
jgi:hypothetical protein